MGKNVADQIVWIDNTTWCAKIALAPGDFFWYRVGKSYGSNEYQTPYGELFLNGEEIAVVILTLTIPEIKHFSLPIPKI